MEAAKSSRGSAGQANIRWMIVYMKDDLCVNFGACIRGGGKNASRPLGLAGQPREVSLA
jgi:hypothetical protein